MDANPSESPGRHRNHKTVLLVDDSPRIRPLIVEILSDCPCEILVAETAEHALRIAAARHAPVDLLLTDITMPGMSGVELAAALRKRYPAMRILFMSGYSMTPPTLEGSGFLEKPFTPAKLLERLGAMLED